MSNNDVVAVWDVPMNDGLYTVEFEHGTLTGKRIIRINGTEILRRDWMFKLIGQEPFKINQTNCVVKVDPHGIFNYSYSLIVDGKSLDTFTENRSKICNTWLVCLSEDIYRVVLEKGTLDVWVNGQKIDTQAEFVDNGTEMRFQLNNTPAYIKAVPRCGRKDGIIYTLIVNDDIIRSTN